MINDNNRNNEYGFQKRWRFLFHILFLFTLNSLLLTLSFAETPKRIISLAPSTTEILFAAGLGDRVVGVTNFCDYPEEAKSRAKIGGMSNPSLEAIASLKPDMVIMTTDGNPKEIEPKLRTIKIKTYVFQSLVLKELPVGLRKMGDVLEAKDGFYLLASKIEHAITKFEKNKKSERKKVLFIVWPEPLVVAGPRTAVDDAIHLLGGINIARDALIRYPKYSLEEIIRQAPDIIFIGRGTGMDIQKASERFLKRVSPVPAVKNNKVFFVGDSLFRLGPRVIEGINELSGYMK